MRHHPGRDPQKTSFTLDLLRKYDSGHIKSSNLIPLHEIENWVSKNKIQDKIIFVCQMGVRSALACEISSAYGADENLLFNLEGGMNEWIINGFEIE